MNRERRNRISDIMERLDAIQTELEEIRDEEQEAFDNMPESIQGSERGENMETGIDTMSECIDNLLTVVEQLEGVCETGREKTCLC